MSLSRPVEVLLAWSGGKDSALALAALRADPAWRVAGLLTTITGDYDRISIHGVRRAVLEAQVAALGLPLVEATIPAAASNAAYEAAFAEALATAALHRPGLRHIAFGDLFLADVRAYREALLARLGWAGVFPLWGQDTAALARRFVDEGYRAILTCVDTSQLAAEFAGRELDTALLAGLPAGVDPCGERGEFHSCVYAGPIFERPLPLVPGERVRRDERFEYCDVLLAPDPPLHSSHDEGGTMPDYPYATHLDVKFGPLELIDVPDLVAACTDQWYNQTLCRVNDAVVRLGVVQGEYHWHKHDDDDEFFYVVSGRFWIDLEGRTIELGPGQGTVVPKGVMHRPRAPDRTVILMVETAGIVPTGD